MDGTIPKDLTLVSSESQERRKTELKIVLKEITLEKFPNQGRDHKPSDSKQ